MLPLLFSMLVQGVWKNGFKINDGEGCMAERNKFEWYRNYDRIW